jgi:hypothetical protein
MAAFLDCGDDSSGTVGALDGPEVSDSDYVLEAKPAAPGPGPGYLRIISLEESLGAVFGMVWCEFYGVYSWSMLYWPALEYCGEPPQVSAVRAGGIWSGYMSEARGLSWERKSRYGKK